MRRGKPSGRTVLLLLAIGAALSACTATASEAGMPYPYGEFGPGFDADPGYLGEAPLYGDFGFGIDWGDVRSHDHQEWHHDLGEPAHPGSRDIGRAFAHGGFAHAGMGHGGSGGHGR
jgi:hypothetical protein